MRGGSGLGGFGVGGEGEGVLIGVGGGAGLGEGEGEDFGLLVRRFTLKVDLRLERVGMAPTPTSEWVLELS